jgi:diketogulonate reductase-like aldo/keto reductase
MKYTIPSKKLQNGFEMPVFGMGTWRMGGRMTKDTTNDTADIEALKTAINSGITHIDTAEKYAEGHAEELVGEAIKDFDRKKLFIVSKVAETHLKYDDVLKSAEASLKRMGTEYMDLYLIHSANDEIPVKETMKAMNYLVENGMTKYIGVSNFTINRVDEAQANSYHKIVANQLHYNLMIREIERKKILEYSQKNDIMVIAWRPLQKGMLLSEGNTLLDDMANKYKKTPAQIAINWLISQDNVVTLSKMTSAIHIKENLGAIGWNLEKQDIKLLRNEYPNQKDLSDAVPLV